MPPGARVARWLILAFGLGVLLKLALVVTAPATTGLKASYWSGASTTGVPERSTEFKDLDGATRIDQRLDLRGDEFPVHFFNDARRFNFGLEPQPGRDQMPFSVRWEGWLVVPSDGERRFELESVGPARAWLDDAELLRTDAPAARQIVDGVADLQAGLHPLRVEYTRPEARVPRLRLSWQAQSGGALQAVDSSALRWSLAPAPLALPDRALDLSSNVILALALVGGIALALARGRTKALPLVAALIGIPLVFLIHGLLFHASLAGRTSILSGLDDWLVYESSARDIVLHGLLMDGGQGHAPAFYGQPLYPYVLALAHWLTGESLFGPLALQFAALGCVVALSGVLAWQAFGSRGAALAALAYVWLFVVVQPEHFRVARQLFNENLYMPLVMASLIALVWLARRQSPPAWWKVALVGMLLGITAITRSQFLAFVPLALLVLLLAWRRKAVAPLLAIVAGLVISIAPVTARNWLVSGELVPISASGGASLLEFHRPPPGLVDQAAIQSDPLFEALRLDTSTRTVLAFARQDPSGYLATLLPPAAHSLGLPSRVSAGIYWPFLITVLLYLAAFGLPWTRRLHVWPIHAFILSHLLILMLFEADTYGYRLVVPMYAPMAVVAAQVPLVLLGLLPRVTRRGWVVAAAVLAGAVLLQARGLADAWPQRETTLRGLGGAAAQAAATADQTNADVIYVASVDGTPRRFGAGTLPGLRYPWFKWFDATRSLPLPADASTAVYALHELENQDLLGDLAACLGARDGSTERVLAGAEVRARCAGGLDAVGATYDGIARIEAIGLPGEVNAGEALEARLVWQPLVAHPEPHQVWLHVVDPDVQSGGVVWGNATLELYPARLWEPGESLLSRLPAVTDATAIPDRYPLVLGMGPTRPNAAPLTAAWHGQRTDRVPVGIVAFMPSQRELSLAQIMPADMRPVAGERLADGGLELVAARAPAGDAWPGRRMRFGLLWLAQTDSPQARRLRVRLLRPDGQTVQESDLPLLGGRASPASLRMGNVVRDEQELEIGPQVSGDALRIEVMLGDGAGADKVTLGSINVVGRARVFAGENEPTEAIFGDRMQMVKHRLEPGAARGGETVTVRLRWQALARIEHTYKVFVHVLDARGEQVLAQRDAEPLSGRAPTTSWMPGEVLDDEFPIQLPGDIKPGEYPIEVGVYEERTGTRLLLAGGENHFVLASRLQVR